MQRSLIAFLVLASCGGPPDPVAPAPQGMPEAGLAPAPSTPADAGPVTVADSGAPSTVVATRVSSGSATAAKVWVSGKLEDCPQDAAFCGPDCVITKTPKGLYKLVDGKKVLLPIPAPPMTEPRLTMSADCTRAAFEVPGSSDIAWETWDVVAGKKLRTSHFRIVGGAADATITESGNFLKWRSSRGLDRYEEIKSGVIGPDIGLATTMSRDERFMFIGGGMTFATNKDIPSELRRPKNGSLVYALPKPKEKAQGGWFCPSGNLLLTAEPQGLAVRSTDDPAVLLRDFPEATDVLFSPDGAEVAIFSSIGKARTVTVVRLERCTGKTCVPLADCAPPKP